MAKVDKDRPNDPNEFKEMQEEEKEDTQTLKDVEQQGKLEPDDTLEWSHEAFEQEFTFVVPSATAYRNAIPTEKIEGGTDGSLAFDTSIVDPLIQQGYVKPTPDFDKMTPAQLTILESAFYNFLKSFTEKNFRQGTGG